VVVGVACLPAVACSGDDDSGTTSTTVALSAQGLDYPSFSDATQPVVVPKGRRFASMLPADPANGWRWRVMPVDRELLAPLGSEFDEDPALLAQATTTTTTAPPPIDSTAPGPGSTDTVVESTTTTVVPGTSTTLPGPLVQIISFAGTARGITTITLRYEQVGTTDAEAEDLAEISFAVFIDDPPLPELPAPETTVPSP